MTFLRIIHISSVLFISLFASSLVQAGQTLPSLFDTPAQRSGFHFQFALGTGAGNLASGTLTILELGYTFENDYTLMFWHPMIENDSNQSPTVASRYPDVLIGIKKSAFYKELVFKIGFGGGGAHEPDFSEASLGLGWAYGVDLHYPMGSGGHGFTLAFTVHHVQLKDRHFVAASLGLGYTVF
jgi:hypothetical protein